MIRCAMCGQLQRARESRKARTNQITWNVPIRRRRRCRWVSFLNMHSKAQSTLSIEEILIVFKCAYAREREREEKKQTLNPNISMNTIILK